MSSKRLSKPILAISVALALAGCGGTDPVAGGDGSTDTGDLLPMAVGNVWEYRVTASGIGGAITKKRTKVLSREVVGGSGPYAALMAFKVETRKGPDLESETDLDKTESWQGPASECTTCADKVSRDPARIIRYRELSYGAMTHALQLEEFWDPPRIHVDGSAINTAAGARWIEEYMETKLPQGAPAIPAAKEQDYWVVASASETITVPNGPFEHSVHLTKSAGTDKNYWYKRGVGKLKEVGDNQTEELVSYTIVGATP